jgi:topoisomerase-4 subunit A
MAKKKKKEIIKENITSQSLDELMGDKFAIYAKDVIQDRAIPDARDGMKPVQRRILFDMWNTGNTIDKPTKKCAHIVGDVMGKYHPHGDSSIYDALVHMSQNWAYRYRSSISKAITVPSMAMGQPPIVTPKPV